MSGAQRTARAGRSLRETAPRTARSRFVAQSANAGTARRCQRPATPASAPSHRSTCGDAEQTATAPTKPTTSSDGADASSASPTGQRSSAQRTARRRGHLERCVEQRDVRSAARGSLTSAGRGRLRPRSACSRRRSALLLAPAPAARRTPSSCRTRWPSTTATNDARRQSASVLLTPPACTCSNMSAGSWMPAAASRSLHFGRMPVARNRPCTLPSSRMPVLLEHEDVLHGDHVAFHAGDLGDAGHLARAVGQARDLDDQVRRPTRSAGGSRVPGCSGSPSPPSCRGGRARRAALLA